MKKIAIVAVLCALYQGAYAEEEGVMDKAGKLWDQASEKVGSYMDQIKVEESDSSFDVSGTIVAIEVKACRKKGIKQDDIGSERTTETFHQISEQQEKSRLSFMTEKNLQQMTQVLIFSQYVSLGTCISSTSYYRVE